MRLRTIRRRTSARGRSSRSARRRNATASTSTRATTRRSHCRSQPAHGATNFGCERHREARQFWRGGVVNLTEDAASAERAVWSAAANPSVSAVACARTVRTASRTSRPTRRPGEGPRAGHSRGKGEGASWLRMRLSGPETPAGRSRSPEAGLRTNARRTTPVTERLVVDQFESAPCAWR